MFRVLLPIITSNPLSQKSWQKSVVLSQHLPRCKTPCKTLPRVTSLLRLFILPCFTRFSLQYPKFCFLLGCTFLGMECPFRAAIKMSWVMASQSFEICPVITDCSAMAALFLIYQNVRRYERPNLQNEAKLCVVFMVPLLQVSVLEKTVLQSWSKPVPVYFDKILTLVQ